MTLLLDCLDPRLGLRVQPARTEDMNTRVAIRILLDALSAPGDRAISAPAIGLPVRILGVRQSDNVTCLLNPRISFLDEFYLSRGETTLHTGQMRRNVMRGRRVIVEGTGLSGRDEKFEMENAPAVSIQQAMELLDQPVPLGWMTSFHHIWSRIGGSEHEHRFAAVSEGLFRATEKTPGVREVAPDLAELLADDGRALGRIDMMNPLLPVRPVDRLLLALLLGFSGMRRIFIADADKLALIVSLLLIGPAASCLMARGQYPEKALGALGLRAVVGATNFDLMDFPDAPGAAPELDAIVVDLTRPPASSDEPWVRLNAVAKSLSGSSGILAVVMPALSPDLEALLQRHFAVLHVFETTDDGPVVYIARKSEADIKVVRARLLTAATRIGVTNELLSSYARAWHLRKDGKRIAQ